MLGAAGGIHARLPARSRFGKGRLDQACVMRALAGARNVRPALLMLGAAGALMRACLRVAASAKTGGEKTFLLNLYRLNRHSRTRCARPG